MIVGPVVLSERNSMRPLQRLISVAVLLSLSSALAGCGGGGLGNFDPTDLLDFLDTKKKLPGERKPVFPEGVPCLQPGVPKDLYKGAQAEPEPPAAPPPVAEPKSKRGSKAASRAKGPAVPAAEAAPDDANVEVGTPAQAPPAPKPRIVRRRTTAPPPEAPAAAPAPQQQAQPAPSAFPAPLPSGGFSR